MSSPWLKPSISALGFVESWNKELWSISYVTCVEIIAEVSLTPLSIFLFSDKPTLKLGIIIIILPTGRSEIILLTSRTTKNEVAFALLHFLIF